MALVPLLPALATVVVTVTPVKALPVLVVVVESRSLPKPKSPPPATGAVYVWRCPGSVTTLVAVCVCDTTMALALPPVAAGL